MESTLANEQSFAVPYVSVPITAYGHRMTRNIVGSPVHYPGHAPWAVVDLDDVIGDFSTMFIDYLMREHGHVLKLQTGHYGLHGALTRDLGEERGKDILKQFYDGNTIRQVSLVPGAWRFLHKLKSIGFHLHALTGRPGWNHRATVFNTMAWVMDNDLPFDSVNFCFQKGKFMRFAMKAPSDGSKVVIAMDDNAEHALDMAAYSTRVYLRQKHYNFGTKDYKVKPFEKFSDVLNDALELQVGKVGLPYSFYPQTSLSMKG